MKQKTIPAGKFKNSCLKIMDDVQRQGIAIVVTKRGKPIVKVIPFQDGKSARDLLGTIVFAADELHSTGESWKAGK